MASASAARGSVRSRHEDAAAARQRLEDAPVVRLEADPPHRARHPELRQVARWSLQRVDQRTARDHDADAGEVEALAGGAECASMSIAASGASFATIVSESDGKPAAFSAPSPLAATRHPETHRW